MQESLQTLEGIPATKATAASPGPDLLIVPIPQVSPAIGTGVTLGGGLFYNPNGSKEPWITSGALMATSNGSWQASKQTPINLRIDYAVGRDSNALYVSVGEPF